MHLVPILAAINRLKLSISYLAQIVFRAFWIDVKAKSSKGYTLHRRSAGVFGVIRPPPFMLENFLERNFKISIHVSLPTF